MPVGDEWTCETTESNVNFLGLKLPFTIGQKTYTKGKYTNYELSIEEAKKRLLDEIDHYEKDELFECKILKKNIVWKMNSNNKYVAIVDYFYEKNIALQQYIDSDKHN